MDQKMPCLKFLRLVCVLFFELLLLVGHCESGITCQDKNGKPVDWFMVYKLPRLSHNPIPLVQQGLAHAYLDPQNTDWTLSDQSINSSHHAVYYTLQQIYKNVHSKNVAYILYNDEKPAGQTTLAHGHTKGDLAFDKQSGFWLVHSVPRFPPLANASYQYPSTGRTYGQAMLCISFTYKYFNSIAQQLLYTWPWVYDYNLPPEIASQNPNLVQVVQGKSVETPPWTHKLSLSSLHGQDFIIFAKSRDFGADLYDAWLAPSLQSSLVVESWQNGRGNMPSNCTPTYQVHNIKGISLVSVDFKETHDHSKWTITTSSTSSKPWVCVGDINRQEEQKKRGGGTVCLSISSVWHTFNKTITAIEPCPKPTKLKNSINIH